jgi:hypothetical protein
VQALRKKETQDETQFTTKIGGKLVTFWSARDIWAIFVIGNSICIQNFKLN